VRFLVPALQTLTGAVGGAAITLGIVGQFLLGPDDAVSASLTAVVLMLAVSSVLGASVLIIVQRPRRSKRRHD